MQITRNTQATIAAKQASKRSKVGKRKPLRTLFSTTSKSARQGRECKSNYPRDSRNILKSSEPEGKKTPRRNTSPFTIYTETPPSHLNLTSRAAPCLPLPKSHQHQHHITTYRPAPPSPQQHSNKTSYKYPSSLKPQPSPAHHTSANKRQSRLQ